MIESKNDSGAPAQSSSLDYGKLLVEQVNRTNDRTFDVVKWVAGLLGFVFAGLGILWSVNLNRERDAIERSLAALDAKFEKLEAQVLNRTVGNPQMEALQQNMQPLEGATIAGKVEAMPEGKVYRLKISYKLRNIGKVSSGPVGAQYYFESATDFGAEPFPDEKGYAVSVYLPPKNWGGGETLFPGNSFSITTSGYFEIVGNTLKKGKYKVLMKTYYGTRETLEIKTTFFVELPETWIRPTK